MPRSRASSAVGILFSLLSRNRIRLITATRPTTMKGCAARRCARSDSTTVCTISTRISTSRTRSSRLMAAVVIVWLCTSSTKLTTPETAKVAARTMSTTPTATVTKSWACSRAQIDAATPGRGAGSASGSLLSLTPVILQGGRVVRHVGLHLPGYPHVALGRRPGRQLQQRPLDVVGGDGGEEMGDHVDPGPPLVVTLHHEPGSLGNVGVQHHLVLGPAVVLPPGDRLQVHG